MSTAVEEHVILRHAKQQLLYLNITPEVASCGFHPRQFNRSLVIILVKII